jgi:V/A-type H+-transporting ATPase subunit C
MARLDHANARIGARRGRLAGARALRELLARPTLEGRLELVRGLPAGAALVREPAEDPLGGAERGLRARLRGEARELLGHVEGRRPRALLAAWLALDEADEVKAVVRGVAAGARFDRTLASFPADTALPGEALRLAAAASSLETAVEALREGGSELAAAVAEALPGAEGLLALELAADRAALARAARACRRAGEDDRILARHLEDLADARNAATLIALDGAAPAAAPWVPGGRRWGEAALDALALAGPEEARAAVAVAFALEARALADPVAAECALGRACTVALRREARLRPLSLAVPLAYLAARRDEVRRLALALRGATLELPADELLDLLEA